MKRFTWKVEKNEWLKAERGISFEDILLAIEDNGILEVLDNPTHPRRYLAVVMLDDYAHAVSLSLHGDIVMLWTAYPSRKLNEQYGG